MAEDDKKSGPRNLVVPIDNSEESLGALQWAMDNMYRDGDTFHLLHIVPGASAATGADPVWFGSYEAPLGMMEREENESVADGLEMVKSKAAPRLDEQSMAYKVHVLTHATTSSGIAKIIGKKAKELHAHCITMAHHQKSALKTWFLGSVCCELVNHGVETPLVFVK